jgi:hypothetical protein
MDRIGNGTEMGWDGRMKMGEKRWKKMGEKRWKKTGWEKSPCQKTNTPHGKYQQFTVV